MLSSVFLRLGLIIQSKMNDLLLFESLVSFCKISKTCFDEIRIVWVLGFMDVIVKYILVINVVIDRV